jgi:hypothetical protein
MPVINFTPPSPLSNMYTHQQAVSEVMVITKTTDNEKIQLSNVRNHLNISIAQVVELVGIANSPRYETSMQCSIETTLHPSGLHWINLDGALVIAGWGTFVPSQGFREIKRVSAKKIDTTYTAGVFANATAQTLWTSITPMPQFEPGVTGWNGRKEGNFTKLDISALNQLSSISDTNVQWSQSIGWTHSGNSIYLFVGSDIATPFQGTYGTDNTDDTGSPYALPFVDIIIYGIRQPMLDDLLAPNVSNTYTNRVDLPDEYMSLCIALTQHKILEQLNADANEKAIITQQIQSELGKIQANVTEKVQFEKIEREKMKYGDQR